MAVSVDSSLSSTPVLESSLSASLASESSLLQRTLSSLSLSSDDVGGQVAALQHGGRHPVAPHHAALLAASAAGWPLAGDASLQALLAGAQAGPLAAGLHSMLVTDAAMAAVLAQHQLALMRSQGPDPCALLAAAAGADPSSSLLAAAQGARQPLLPLSLNLGHPHFAAPPRLGCGL
jgi:hypothetical protein